MIDALKKNDKVVTAGGIYGTVVSVDPAGDKLVLRIDDDKGVKLTMSRSSVMRSARGLVGEGVGRVLTPALPCWRRTPPERPVRPSAGSAE